MCSPAVSNKDKNLNPFCSRMTFVTNRKLPCRKGGFGTQAAADCPPPPPPRVAKAGRKHLNKEITPPPPHWYRRAIQPNQIKFRTCSALAPLRTPPINESAELTQGDL